MKCLILYHSKYGQTEKISRRIANSLESKQVSVDVSSIAELGPKASTSGYDLVVIGAPIYLAKHSNLIGSFIKHNLHDLSERTSVFFSVSLSAYGNQYQKHDAQKCVDEFLGKYGWSPNLHNIFAGAVPYQKYNWFVRWTMKRIMRKAGGDTDTTQNFEYTDWDRVDEFANQVFECASRDLEVGKNRRPIESPT